jgi:hypothetical protein
MKISKVTFTIGIIIVIILILTVGRFAYSLGQHNASLTIKGATPKQLAEEMQSDNFYSEYTKTMLLVSGKIKTVTQQNSDTIVQFEVANSPSALGNVACGIRNDQGVKQGDTVRVLTVAYDTERQRSADVFMPNCYLIKQ